MIQSCELYQNSPNPFTENTIIRCEIPSYSSNAYINIYDMHGRQLDSIQIKEPGESRTIISAGDLKAGMYIYSLMVDGKLIDSKQMLITNEQ